MRDILFKAKRKDNGEWVEGFLFKTQEHTYIAYDRQFDDDLFFSPNNIFIVVDENTICQYTGLTDKNGNKIWENDIVWDSEQRELYKMIWCQDNMRYCVENGDGFDYEFDSSYAISLETNGNIFDNPELIGE